MSSLTSQAIFLIDPPTPFAPAEEWRAFLADLESIEEKTPQIEEEIRAAKAHLAELAD